MTTVVRIEARSSVAWWRPLVQGVLCIPHLLYTGVLAAASLGVAVAIAGAVAVTGRVPARAAAFEVLALRERLRCYSYFFVLRSSRPPYATRLSTIDPGDDPLVELTVVPPRTAPRRSALVRPFVVLPHLVVLVPIGAVMDLCYPAWMALAAANRGWPEGLERLLLRIEAWVAAVVMFLTFLTDEVPRFGLAAYDPTGGRAVTVEGAGLRA
jgi:hypothetical protein